MKESQVRAIFELAGIPVKSFHRIENKYWPKNEHYDDVRRDSPWWLASTAHGLIEIGWRKRVISIDWSDTPVRFVVTPDDVTKDETMVHAYSYGKAVDYLKVIAIRFAALENEKAEALNKEEIKNAQ